MSFATTPYRPSHLALAYTQVYSFYTRKLRFISLAKFGIFIVIFSRKYKPLVWRKFHLCFVCIFPGNIVQYESFKSHFELLEYILQLSLTGTWHLESKMGSFSEKKCNMLLELCWFRFLQNNIILCLNMSLPIFINVGLLLGNFKEGKVIVFRIWKITWLSWEIEVLCLFMK